jgi:hypothetical protein
MLSVVWISLHFLTLYETLYMEWFKIKFFTQLSSKGNSCFIVAVTLVVVVIAKRNRSGESGGSNNIKVCIGIGINPRNPKAHITMCVNAK